jgi:YfiH family protein
MSHNITYLIGQKFPEINCFSLWTPERYFNQLNTATPVLKKYLQMLNALNMDTKKIAFAQQVHSNRILVVNHSGMLKDCDGFITQKSDLTLIIRTADCAAIMIYDRQNHIIANLHAGWRGINKLIISNCLNILYNTFDCKKNNIFVAVSPFIQSCCYQVGEEFKNMFIHKYLVYRGKSIYFDLKSAINYQLHDMGISPTKIEICDRCTMCDAEFLPSFRRTNTTNRMFSMIRKNVI